VAADTEAEADALLRKLKAKANGLTAKPRQLEKNGLAKSKEKDQVQHAESDKLANRMNRSLLGNLKPNLKPNFNFNFKNGMPKLNLSKKQLQLLSIQSPDGKALGAKPSLLKKQLFSTKVDAKQRKLSMAKSKSTKALQSQSQKASKSKSTSTSKSKAKRALQSQDEGARNARKLQSGPGGDGQCLFSYGAVARNPEAPLLNGDPAT
jgi:hypothetical protein